MPPDRVSAMLWRLRESLDPIKPAPVSVPSPVPVPGTGPRYPVPVPGTGTGPGTRYPVPVPARQAVSWNVFSVSAPRSALRPA